MADRSRPSTRSDGPISAQRDAGASPSQSADAGQLVMLATYESITRRELQQPLRSIDAAPGRPSIHDDPFAEPEPMHLIRLSAQKLWAEGRANPIDWVCRSWIGDWLTGDRVTWRTADGLWLAQLQRSANGRHVFLGVWRSGCFLGYQDGSGWHPATNKTRSRRPHSVHRSLPLPMTLALAG